MSRLCLLLVLVAGVLSAESVEIHHTHGLSRFDELKYGPDFTHYDYAEPGAPKGGSLSLNVGGSFDNLNPYSLNGRSPSFIPTIAYLRYGFSELNEPLMVGAGNYSPSGDEVKAAYGLIAESIEYPDNNRWIIFNLRREARFHDGHPITADDVVFSYHALKENGHPRYRMQLAEVDRVEKLSAGRVQFFFKKEGNRNQLFRAAGLPVLSKSHWQDKSIDQSSLTPPLNSGPYKITNIQLGESVTFSRVKDYWGKDLPVNKGRYNFDTVTLNFHRNMYSAFEAFKKEDHDIHVEVVAKRWMTAYGFPAIKSGRVKKRELPHNLAVGSTFFYFNTRKPPFDDLRVRKAISLLFDFEWTNKALFYSSYVRAKSYFPNTFMASKGVPDDGELHWLNRWRKELPEALFKTSFEPSVTAGNGDVRAQRKKAIQLLKEAGWVLKEFVMTNLKTGKPLKFTFVDDHSGSHRYLLPFKNNLESIGVKMNLIELNTSEYYQRVKSLDFDMLEFTLPQTQSPDSELESFFHSSNVNTEGTLNLAGVQNPMVDELLLEIPKTKTWAELQSLVHSLDRILLWNYYGIPKWHSVRIRVAHKDVFGWPDKAPLFTAPFSTWWRKDQRKVREHKGESSREQ